MTVKTIKVQHHDYHDDILPRVWKVSKTILNNTATRFKVGDLSSTSSESLGDFLRKWGIPAIPRPRINTGSPTDFREGCHHHLLKLSHTLEKQNQLYRMISITPAGVSLRVGHWAKWPVVKTALPSCFYHLCNYKSLIFSRLCRNFAREPNPNALLLQALMKLLPLPIAAARIDFSSKQ